MGNDDSITPENLPWVVRNLIARIDRLDDDMYHKDDAMTKRMANVENVIRDMRAEKESSRRDRIAVILLLVTILGTLLANLVAKHF